jgi:DNA-binding transcriptional ArsR family regulator
LPRPTKRPEPHRIPGNGLPSPLTGKYCLTDSKECVLGAGRLDPADDPQPAAYGSAVGAEIAAKMKVSRPAVSQALKSLLEARLVQREIRGRQAFYRLDARGLEDARTYIEGLENVIEKFDRGGGRLER